MDTVMLATRSGMFAITNPGGNYSTNGFIGPKPQTTSPALTAFSGQAAVGDGIITLGHGGLQSPNAVLLAFFGVGSNGNTFAANIYGWRPVPMGQQTSPGNVDLWVPVLLAGLTAITLNSSVPGVAGTLVASAQFFASAVTLSVGNSNWTSEVISPGSGNAQAAHALINAKGFRYLQVDYSTTGVATSCNGLWTVL